MKSERVSYYLYQMPDCVGGVVFTNILPAIAVRGRLPLIRISTINPSGSEEDDELMVNICPSFVEPVMEKEACPPFTGGTPLNPSSSRS